MQKIFMIKNTSEQFGLVTKLIHWLSAFTILALFVLGFWMVDLDYYNDWYQTAPHWHESVGILLLIVTLLRVFWRLINVTPEPLENQSVLIVKSAKLAHLLLYCLLLLVMFSGYLIPTADDRVISVFNWFDVISFGELFSNQEDISGLIHEYAAYSLIALSLLHALAAIKHHYINKDATLQRMM